MNMLNEYTFPLFSSNLCVLFLHLTVLAISENRRRISIEEARRLSIISFNTAPQDTKVLSSQFSEDEGKTRGFKKLILRVIFVLN